MCRTSYLFIYFVFLGLHLLHMEVPRLGVESELQLPAYATATAIHDQSCPELLHATGVSRGKKKKKVQNEVRWSSTVNNGYAEQGVTAHNY